MPTDQKTRLDLFNKIYLSQHSSDIFKIDPETKFDIEVSFEDSEAKTISISKNSTPSHILQEIISKKNRSSYPMAISNGIQIDLNKPLESPCTLYFPKFTHQKPNEALKTYWHSCAHILGAVLEKDFSGTLEDGPATERGFYYDVISPTLDSTLKTKEDYEAVMARIKESFESSTMKNLKNNKETRRIELSREEAREMFAGNEYKLDIIEKHDKITAYAVGDFVDLCRGPHIPVLSPSYIHIRDIVSINKTKRVYAVAFPSAKELKKYLDHEETLKNCDHRKIGSELKLFFQHRLSPGSTFWLPKGTVIYSRLTEMMRDLCAREYTEVITPNIFSNELFDRSGHSAHYAENMFTFPVEEQPFSLKPMNCPGHCMLFERNVRSYRELPLRFMEFGVLHRNELSGALKGLTRVRKFVQDDAHIFCREDEVYAEIMKILRLVETVYGIFGFEYKAELSTKPEKALNNGDWDFAEGTLEKCLEETMKGRWAYNRGDGAFYAPKIDFKLFDKMGREFQCATVQMDIQTPERFNLSFMDGDNSWRKPLMIHRAVLGSLERFIAILIEHYEGKFPFWISPYQFYIICIGESYEYAAEVAGKLKEMRIEVEIDNSERTVSKKIVAAREMKYCYIACIGEREMNDRSITLRKKNENREIVIDEFYSLCGEAIKKRQNTLFNDF